MYIIGGFFVEYFAVRPATWICKKHKDYVPEVTLGITCCYFIGLFAGLVALSVA